MFSSSYSDIYIIIKRYYWKKFSDHTFHLIIPNCLVLMFIESTSLLLFTLSWICQLFSHYKTFNVVWHLIRRAIAERVWWLPSRCRIIEKNMHAIFNFLLSRFLTRAEAWSSLFFAATRHNTSLRIILFHLLTWLIFAGLEYKYSINNINLNETMGYFVAP
jgi:hypothetical protein